MTRDLYAETLALQNSGEPCRHCSSASGHYQNCALLHREAAELASVEAGKLDNFFLASLRVAGL